MSFQRRDNGGEERGERKFGGRGGKKAANAVKCVTLQ